MKLLREKKVRLGSLVPHYDGRPGTEQVFEIEEADVGVTRAHYQGFRHSDYKFTRSDVGRQIMRQRDESGWTCWFFMLNPIKPVTVYMSDGGRSHIWGEGSDDQLYELGNLHGYEVTGQPATEVVVGVHE
ncbi:hypothetical protein [Chitinibacter tainanensis]|uniref:hypothetical protein n=1 Tax=Chitinibacter tainanensis TaxID=230667 RepID=UPI000491CA3A|nr:hypothetical protein [Chitinibacter tainanensis]